jgi:hypothetical protein
MRLQQSRRERKENHRRFANGYFWHTLERTGKIGRNSTLVDASVDSKRQSVCVCSDPQLRSLDGRASVQTARSLSRRADREHRLHSLVFDRLARFGTTSSSLILRVRASSLVFTAQLRHNSSSLSESRFLIHLCARAVARRSTTRLLHLFGCTRSMPRRCATRLAH